MYCISSKLWGFQVWVATTSIELAFLITTMNMQIEHSNSHSTSTDSITSINMSMTSHQTTNHVVYYQIVTLIGWPHLLTTCPFGVHLSLISWNFLFSLDSHSSWQKPCKRGDSHPHKGIEFKQMLETMFFVVISTICFFHHLHCSWMHHQSWPHSMDHSFVPSSTKSKWKQCWAHFLFACIHRCFHSNPGQRSTRRLNEAHDGQSQARAVALRRAHVGCTSWANQLTQHSTILHYERAGAHLNRYFTPLLKSQSSQR